MLELLPKSSAAPSPFSPKVMQLHDKPQLYPLLRQLPPQPPHPASLPQGHAEARSLLPDLNGITSRWHLNVTGPPTMFGRACMQGVLPPELCMQISECQCLLELVPRPQQQSHPSRPPQQPSRPRAGLDLRAPGSAPLAFFSAPAPTAPPRPGDEPELEFSEAYEVKLTALAPNFTFIKRKHGTKRLAARTGGVVMLGHGDKFWMHADRPDAAIVIQLHGTSGQPHR